MDATNGLYARIQPLVGDPLPIHQVGDLSDVKPGMIATLNIPKTPHGNTLGLVLTRNETSVTVALIVAPDAALATRRDVVVPVHSPDEPTQASNLRVVVAVDLIASISVARLEEATVLGFAPDDVDLLTLILWGHRDDEQYLAQSAINLGYTTGLNSTTGTEIDRRTTLVRALAAAAWADLDDG